MTDPDRQSELAEALTQANIAVLALQACDVGSATAALRKAIRFTTGSEFCQVCGNEPAPFTSCSACFWKSVDVVEYLDYCKKNKACVMFGQSTVHVAHPDAPERQGATNLLAARAATLGEAVTGIQKGMATVLSVETVRQVGFLHALEQVLPLKPKEGD